MGKLHEVLAVEADREGIAKRIMDESRQNFSSKHQLFLGATRSLKMDEDGHESLEAANSETQAITTTVPARLDYTAQAITKWLNTVAQKEFTNQQTAKADLVVDDITIAKDVPATFLLGLENKLKNVRSIYDAIPTLSQGQVWLPDDSNIKHTFRAESPDIKAKTQKTVKSRVLYEATKEHPAQIDKWTEESVVGKYTTHFTSGMISASRKMELLSKVDRLIQATKKARQRANNCDVVKTPNIGKALFDYINS